jgi:uncharacterized membrane protein
MGPGEPSTARWAADLLLVVALALAIVGAWLVGAPEPVRLVLAVLAVFLPGYSLIAVLFPRRRLETDESPSTLAERVEQLDAVDRLALSVATGLVVTPLLGIALDFSPWSLREGPTLATIAGFVVVTAVIAAIRRRALPAARRYDPATRWARGLGDANLRSGHTLVTGLVVLAVLVAAGGVFAVASTEQQGERFTEFSVLGTDNGSTVAASYPETVTAGEETTVVLGIENHEGRQRNYTVVTRLQTVTRVDNRTVVQRQERFDPVSVTVDANETVRFEHAVHPTNVGSGQRLLFLLYRGDPAAQPRPSNAYRWTHVWLDVTATQSTTG